MSSKGSETGAPALVPNATTLRAFLLSAAATAPASDASRTLTQNLAALSARDADAALLLDHTAVALYTSQALPRANWTVATSLSHTELIQLAIERLLVRRRANADDTNVLTLGYREAAPGLSGHRVSSSNGVVCYFPNTLVALLKKAPAWHALHHAIGDDLLLHLLLHYIIVVELQDAPGAYIQVAGKSLRYSALTRGLGGTSSSSSNGATRKHAHQRTAVSINEVLYARHVHASRVFGPTHVLVAASKSSASGAGVSRAAAGRVIRSIFFADAATASEPPRPKPLSRTTAPQRLPKRLVNLVPLVQTLLTRFRDTDIDALVQSLVRVPPAFRQFMHEHAALKPLAATAPRTAQARVRAADTSREVALRALESAYASQDDSDDAADRKRKRREQAINDRSSASSAAAAVSRKRSPKRRRLSQALADPSSSACSSLSQLRAHRDEIAALTAIVVPKRVVQRLVHQVVARIVPKEIWGPSPEHTAPQRVSNWQRVKELLGRLVHARKYDVLSLQECCREMQVKRVAWMNAQGAASNCPPNELRKRQELFQSLLAWLLQALVLPLLRHVFYITECEGASNEIVYYQRDVWAAISNIAVHDLTAGILEPAPSSSAAAPRQLATSRLRLLPKVSGVRPLMNLSTPVDKRQRSVNRALEPLHRVLLFEAERETKTRLLGASVRSMDEIYQRIQPLFTQIRSCASCATVQRERTDAPALYCVSVDIERCFDTIRPRKLYRLLKKMVREDEYLIRRHWVYQRSSLVNTGSRRTQRTSRRRASSVIFKLERPAYCSGDLQTFDEVVAKSKKRRHAVYLDGVLYDYVPKRTLLTLLKEHLFANTVAIEGQDFVQARGIPQGSILSTLLCNLYYAEFERKVVWRRLGAPYLGTDSSSAPRPCHHEELMRYTDDFLFLTTSIARAQAFVRVLHDRHDDFGCAVNFAKSRVNFDVAVKRSESAALSPVPRFDREATSDGRVSWCGMLLDPVALQIFVNYENSLTQASIPFDATKVLRDFFVNKVLSSVRQRWHALYFDTRYQSKVTVHENLFQLLSLAAVRFVLIVDMLPFVNRDVRFFYDSMHDVIGATARGIARCLQVAGASSASLGARLMQDSRAPRKCTRQCASNRTSEVWRIGLLSFEVVLERKRAQTLRGQRKRSSSSGGGGGEFWAALLALIVRDREQELESECGTEGTADDIQWLARDSRSALLLTRWLAPPLAPDSSPVSSSRRPCANQHTVRR